LIYLRPFLITATIFGLVFAGVCGTTNEANRSVQTQPGKLFSRAYTITTETFASNLKKLAGAKAGESNSQRLLRFFKENDVEIKPPESIYLSEEKNKLFVRSTEVHQNQIERLVAAIQNDVPPAEVR
jgi:hypothetical protein